MLCDLFTNNRLDALHLNLSHIRDHCLQLHILPSRCPLDPSLDVPQASLNKYIWSGTSVQFSRSVVSNSLRPREPQHTRPPCPSPTPGVYPNSCPLDWWCHLTISSSVIPFSSCLQSFPTSGSFHMSHFFTSGGQNIGVSASTSVFAMNTQDWFPSLKYLFSE